MDFGLQSAALLKYKLVIFDSDGTLADTLPWMRGVFNELAEEFGFRKVAPEEYELFRDLHGTALLKKLDLPLWKLPRVVNAMRRKMAAHSGNFTMFTGIAGALQALTAAGKQLAIVSSNSQENVARILGAHAAQIHHFACGVSMFGKAARLRAVARAASVLPTQAIYIGDEIRDAEAARKAGLAFGAVAWGQHSTAALRGQCPDEFFEAPEQIVSRLC